MSWVSRNVRSIRETDGQDTDAKAGRIEAADTMINAANIEQPPKINYAVTQDSVTLVTYQESQ